jgi:hypothetical protein
MSDAASIVPQAEVEKPLVPVPGEIDGVVYREVEMKFKAPQKRLVEQAVKNGETPPIQRPSFSISIPQYPADAIIALMNENPKVRDFVTSTVNAVVFDEARAQVVSDENPVNDDANLDKSKLTLIYISSLDADQRASRVEIDKDQLAAFATLFEKAMPAINGISSQGAKLVAQACKTRLAAWKQKPEVLKQVKELLRVFAGGISEADLDPLTPVLEYLDSQCNKYIEKPEIDKLEALLAS